MSSGTETMMKMKCAQDASPCGPITSQANRHSDLVNELHRALDGLFSRLNPILANTAECSAKDAPKPPPVCELYGRITNSNDALNDALSRIEELQNRIQL